MRELAVKALLYGDSAYTEYGLENLALKKRCILLMIKRKSTAKRINTFEQKKEKLKIRISLETTISDIKKIFPKTIHAIALEDFINKLTLCLDFNFN